MDKFIHTPWGRESPYFCGMASPYARKIPLLDCGHEYIRRVLHGRWKIVLLLRIANGHQRPGELARTIPQASRRVLDAQLLELVAHGVVRKTVFDEVIQHVEYELTELGQSLLPVITVMGEWGSTHIQHLRETIK
jgi:DNA-binding HxlR family transcriptional regulator